MYVPEHFAERRTTVLLSLIEAHPLATLIVAPAGQVVANHLPLMWRASATGAGMLRGHVARANPLWRTAGDGIDALAIFHGPSAYVSPSHYPSKAASGRVVPTWNYAVVHVHGRLRAIDATDWVDGLVTELTDSQERARAQPWAVADAPREFVVAQLRAIVGIELEIAHMEGKFKLSQNRDAHDRDGVLNGLADDADGAALAALMGGQPPA